MIVGVFESEDKFDGFALLQVHLTKVAVQLIEIRVASQVVTAIGHRQVERLAPIVSNVSEAHLMRIATFGASATKVVRCQFCVTETQGRRERKA